MPLCYAQVMSILRFLVWYQYIKVQFYCSSTDSSHLVNVISLLTALTFLVMYKTCSRFLSKKFFSICCVRCSYRKRFEWFQLFIEFRLASWIHFLQQKLLKSLLLSFLLFFHVLSWRTYSSARTTRSFTFCFAHCNGRLVSLLQRNGSQEFASDSSPAFSL